MIYTLYPREGHGFARLEAARDLPAIGGSSLARHASMLAAWTRGKERAEIR